MGIYILYTHSTEKCYAYCSNLDRHVLFWDVSFVGGENWDFMFDFTCCVYNRVGDDSLGHIPNIWSQYLSLTSLI